MTWCSVHFPDGATKQTWEEIVAAAKACPDCQGKTKGAKTYEHRSKKGRFVRI